MATAQVPHLRYTAVELPALGRTHVAYTPDGLTALQWGVSESEFRAAVTRSTGSPPTADAGGQQPWQDTLCRFLAGELACTEVAVDLSFVSPFQRAVLAAAREIPRGSVRTYGWIAAAVGRPGAARAVGRAMATNPVALVVP